MQPPARILSPPPRQFTIQNSRFKILCSSPARLLPHPEPTVILPANEYMATFTFAPAAP
jgi:hypothetical protein